MTKNNNFITICLYLVIVICFIFIINNVYKKNFKEGMTPQQDAIIGETQKVEETFFGTNIPGETDLNAINISKAPYEYFSSLELEAYLPTMQEDVFYSLTKGITSLNPKEKSLPTIESLLDMSQNGIKNAQNYINTEKQYLNLLGIAGLNSQWTSVNPNFIPYYNEKMKFLNSMNQFLGQYSNNNNNNNNNWWNFGRSNNNKTDPSGNGLQNAWNSASSGAQKGWQSVEDDFGWNKKN